MSFAPDSISKLIALGSGAITDAELLGMVLGSETLAQQVLASVDNNLHDLGKLSVSDLQKMQGIGRYKAATIVAMVELGRRRGMSDIRTRPKITSSRDAFNVIAPLLADLHHEEFWIIVMDRSNKVRCRQRISVGGTSGTVADVKMVMKLAIENRASAFIAVHNHPSGSLEPSQADIELTRKMKEAASIMEMPMLDHLIISDQGYYSFADEGNI